VDDVFHVSRCPCWKRELSGPQPLLGFRTIQIMVICVWDGKNSTRAIKSHVLTCHPAPSSYCTLVTTGGKRGHLFAFITPGVYSTLSDKARSIWVRRASTLMITAAVLQQRRFLSHLFIVRKPVALNSDAGNTLTIKKAQRLSSWGLAFEYLRNVSGVATLYILPATRRISPHLYPSSSLSPCCVVGLRKRQPPVAGDR
jgi:hypothetical protein